ncbi:MULTISPECIES: XRE family transcriptional regulator [Pseudomonas]|nr:MULTISPECIES: XRE family transcriptional regulator [Pseudomonas]AZD36979.1 transcriptional regulator [Pseudomonas chlororaphis subsp. aurantiaca]AZD43318.1 transcriptional regulator [Pseudomonas chlororaphis subsp. aurantiaca]AZD49561.1 transcriptional regulator [Pseudomonas chlororaphis subsp. aurantiaca]AZD80685.1 transcriptional regulator [Pseudomonas chlororaphis subsp. aurantiaca]AZD93760.1 transcriptional regulator [Pseudomonas chlororaphis subsp. aureofaciens]
MSEINPKQITFARVRRRFTKAQLAKELGITSRSLQNYETGASYPDPGTLEKIAKLLNFPQQFFFIDEEMPELREHSVSFRKLSKMTDALKACTFAAGAIAFKVNHWIEERFSLPLAELPDLSDLEPEEAAATLRRAWGLGNAPIPNMVHLLESKGIRVFSLAEETREVDAFCTWYEGKPFVFLNTIKSAERSRFDAAHELGHLVRDVYTMQHGQAHGPEMERQADAFAAAFLMPKESVAANQPPAYTIKYLMKLKHYWGVSLAALAYRFSSLGLVSEWNYRGLCIEIARSGYRTNEPEPMERETSQLLTKVLDILHSRKQGRREIAESLSLSIDEINALTFQLTRLSVISGKASADSRVRKDSPKLRLI